MNQQQAPQGATNAGGNATAMTVQRINSLPSVADMVEMEQVEKAWITTYEKTTGKADGATRFAGEKIAFLECVSAYGFRNVDNYSKYSAFIDLAISGLSLREGLAYIIPYGKKASFMPGWKGRLEQLNEMPEVVFVHPPQIVREGDVFEKELGMSPRVVKHIPLANNQGRITEVYLVVEFKSGARCYFMDAAAIVNIRNRRSKTFISYCNACAQLNIDPWDGRTFENQQGKQEPPMWITDEAQAFKKTLVKRVYTEMPNKLGKHKHLDQKAESAAAAGAADPEDELTEQDFNNMGSLVDEPGEDQQQQGEDGGGEGYGGY